ncbi:hypothetical protein PFISCL1PPCAC_25774 [Pristionchus fissidentatus]|uniref:G protein-coupled receptor n=1 Tax=Pristionchus fissidentatus TaxID=1538716 RepID=A0AAV5WR36_9BILA|nr:hypothetical protein PFISCL1PPCAC_25774 [Pristionchus fissidentatus]
MLEMAGSSTGLMWFIVESAIASFRRLFTIPSSVVRLHLAIHCLSTLNFCSPRIVLSIPSAQNSLIASIGSFPTGSTECVASLIGAQWHSENSANVVKRRTNIATFHFPLNHLLIQEEILPTSHTFRVMSLLPFRRRNKNR